MNYLEMKFWDWLQRNAMVQHRGGYPQGEPFRITWHDTDTHTVIKSNDIIIVEERLI